MCEEELPDFSDKQWVGQDSAKVPLREFSGIRLHLVDTAVQKTSYAITGTVGKVTSF